MVALPNPLQPEHFGCIIKRRPKPSPNHKIAISFTNLTLQDIDLTIINILLNLENAPMHIAYIAFEKFLMNVYGGSTYDDPYFVKLSVGI